MSKVILDRLFPFTIAALIVLTALLFMLWLDPWIPMTKSPFLLFFGAIIISAWYKGKATGIFATLLSTACANYFFQEPKFQFSLDLTHSSRLVVYLLEGFMISVLCGNLRAAEQRAQKSLALLQASEAKFRRLVDSNITGVVSATIHGEITEANDAFLTLLGYSREELLAGRIRWDEMTPPEFQEADQVAVKELITNGKNTPYEKAYFDKKGHPVPILVGAALLEDESRENVISFIIDLTQQKRAEQRLAIQYSVTRVLAEASTMDEGLPPLLQSLCERLGWQRGLIWLVDQQSNELHCRESWQTDNSNLEAKTVAAFRKYQNFKFGEGLPGQVWLSCQPRWISNLQEDNNFPRIAIATQLGLKSALAFPILLENKVLGVIECFSDRIQEPDELLMEILLGVGSQIGQFIERQRIKSALQESQELFSSFMSYSPAWAYIKDEAGHYVYVNPPIERDFCRNLADWVGKTDFDLLPATLAQEWRDNDLKVLKLNQTLQSLESLPPEVKGQYAMSFKFPFQDGSGRRFLAGMSIDVSDRILMEQTLRASEERYRTLINALPHIVWGTDAKGSLEYANSQWFDYFGFPATGDLSQRLSELAHPNDYKNILSVWQQALETGQMYDTLLRLKRHRDQDYRWFHSIAVPVRNRDDQIEMWVGCWLDIDSEQRIQQALRESAERLSLALAASQMGDWSWDARTDIVTLSTRAAEIFEIPSGPYMTWTQMRQRLHEADRDRAQNAVEQAIAQRGGYDIEYRVILDNGEQRWVSVKGQAQYSPIGQVLGMLGVLQDITERKHAEAEREQLLALEQAARAEAEAANRIKDEFLAVLSHELRSPLNPILGWSRLLRTRQFEPEARDRALETIERNAKLQTQLIEDLLDVSRILRGKMSLNVGPVYLAPVLEAALETVRLAAETKGLEIQTQLDQAVGLVWGDSSRLQQIVWNLLSNAVKFTPSGGQVQVQLQRVNSQAQITVEDTGVGISSEFLPFVFDYFRQADSATTRRFGGLGLGLAIVRHLTELHGGTVEVESAGEGQGTRFTVRLPLPQTPVVEPQSPSFSNPQMDLNGLRILVVDDEPDMRELVQVILESSGADVKVAASAKEALSVLEKSVPDVLISDIGMPEMDGYSLLGWLRSQEALQGGNIPAIALTAYAGEFDRKKALDVGFHKHIAKPVEPTTLVQAILSVLTLPHQA